jgi:hypothetical protein
MICDNICQRIGLAGSSPRPLRDLCDGPFPHHLTIPGPVAQNAVEGILARGRGISCTAAATQASVSCAAQFRKSPPSISLVSVSTHTSTYRPMPWAFSARYSVTHASLALRLPSFASIMASKLL